MLLVEEFSETGLFRHLPNHVFRVGNFGNIKDLRVIFFLKKVQNLGYISKMQQKAAKKSFVSQTIPSELLSLNCLY